MQARLTDRPVERVVAAIQALDLDPIKLKLMDAEEGQGWSREHADRMELGYKRFLTLLASHPEETLAPSKDVDKFWHGHILDTLKYAEDCHKVFGYFLHHFPYFGMRGAEDAANLARAAETTQRLYQEEFGSAQSSTAAYCGATSEKAAYCGATQAEKPAYCGAVRAESAAYCGVISEKAAYCGATQAEKPAYCGAVRAESAAYCGVISEKAAYCGATQAEKPAYCGAVHAESAAYCGVISEKAAYCGATQVEKPAYCGAIKKESLVRGGTVSTPDKLKVSVRPSL